jgi:uncharacterized protein
MTYAGPKSVLEIVALAGGSIVGRTRLQKCTCGLELTGLGFGFQFSYKHFGPYSEELKVACDDANALGLVHEQRKRALWGGEYSVFVTDDGQELKTDNVMRPVRSAMLQAMSKADPVVLELTITAAYLAAKRTTDPWGEVQERKSDKASEETIAKSKALYRELQAIQTPARLPDIA